MRDVTFIDAIANAVSKGQGGPLQPPATSGEIDFLADWRNPAQQADQKAWEASYDRFESWVHAAGGEFDTGDKGCTEVGWRMSDDGVGFTQEFEGAFTATIPGSTEDTFLAVAGTGIV
jgi:hypothetical protein